MTTRRMISKRKLADDIVLSTSCKPKQNACPDANIVYLLGGLCTGPSLTALLRARLQSAVSFECFFLPLSHKHRTYIALFTMRNAHTQVVLFERDTGVATVRPLTQPEELQFELPRDATWDDCYTFAEPRKQHCKKNPNVVHRALSVNLTSIDETRFVPKRECDALYNFSTCTSSLVNEHGTTLPKTLSQTIATRCAMLAQTNSWCDSLAFVYYTSKDNPKHIAFIDVVNLLGVTAHHVRIALTPDMKLTAHMGSIVRLARGVDELDLGSSLWDAMSAAELNAFTSTQFANILNQVQTTGVTSLSTVPPPTRHKLIPGEGDSCDTWMRFMHSHLAPRACFSTAFVAVTLLHIPSAWRMFDSQIMQMKQTDTPIVPRIMFHGVRGEQVQKTVDVICKHGFNHKYTQNCVYGAGGTYCSPQITCALEFTAITTNKQRFVFVCMVVPGKVCYGGQQGQYMAPDQHSWIHDLDNGHQIYCAETIVPFALLTFVP